MKARNNFQFDVYLTHHVVWFLFIVFNTKSWMSETVDVFFVRGLAQPQNEDVLFRRRMLRRLRWMRFSVLMLSRPTVRTLTEWFWFHAFMICLQLFENWRLVNWELHLMMWLWLMRKESLLGNLNACIRWEFLSQERILFLVTRVFKKCLFFNCLAEMRFVECGSIPTIMYL